MRPPPVSVTALVLAALACSSERPVTTSPDAAISDAGSERIDISGFVVLGTEPRYVVFRASSGDAGAFVFGPLPR